MQNESEFEHNAAASRFVAKLMSEILNTFTAFRKLMIILQVMYISDFF